MNHNIAAIILAAGKGTRMKSSMPKVMHRLANKPMINHVLDACQKANIRDNVVVIAPNMDQVAQSVAPAKTVIQEQALGTGDAAKAASAVLNDYNGYIFILNGDLPFIQPDTLSKLYETAQGTGLAILGFEANDPHGYGRLLTNKDDNVIGIIEEKDCTASQREITLCNAGAYCVRGDKLFGWLDQLSDNNVQGEYYLTDIITIAAKDKFACGYITADITETIGINSRAQLAEAETILQHSLRQKALDQGVTMVDPDTVYLSDDTHFANDVVIEPNVFFGPGVAVGEGTIIHAFSHLEGVEIGNNASIGPFARLRPQSKIGDHVTVGNFIEVNRSEFKDGSKSKHVSYIGDAVIGEKTNIGAGTVFANYDGFNKQNTTVGNGVFVGSNSTIISPVEVGDGAIIAAGSTITQDIDENAMALARTEQKNIGNKATAYRDKKRNAT